MNRTESYILQYNRYFFSIITNPVSPRWDFWQWLRISINGCVKSLALIPFDSFYLLHILLPCITDYRNWQTVDSAVTLLFVSYIYKIYIYIYKKAEFISSHDLILYCCSWCIKNLQTLLSQMVRNSEWDWRMNERMNVRANRINIISSSVHYGWLGRSCKSQVLRSYCFCG